MTIPKYLFTLALIAGTVVACAQSSVSNEEKKALEQTTLAIRNAFARGDVPAIVALHHPDVIKYFGGENVVKGREALEKGLKDMFSTTKMEFADHQLESLVFVGETAIETSIFTIRSVSKNGGTPATSRGRAMVVYVRYKGSPTGWASIREMAQAAPSENK
jgi:ketosteroid isomerase-like protein